VETSVIMSLPTIAILDDYQEISKSHFERLRSAGFQVTTFTDTLLPYNHPDTPQDAKDALVKRLEPFNIICKLTLCFPRSKFKSDRSQAR
jgi:hypothetical protein